MLPSEMLGLPLKVARGGRRKTVALHLTSDRQVELRAPAHVSDGFLLKFLEDRRRWLRKSIREHDAVEKMAPAVRKFVDGEKFLYLGRRCRLRLASGALFGQSGVEFVDDELRLTLGAEDGCAPESVKRQLEEWFMARAGEELGERVARHAALMGLRPRRVRVRPMKSLWGSCSEKSDISFNSHIVKAPPEVIDYIVVHELAHIAHRDHSQRFWALVERFHPRAGAARRWLRRNGEALLR